MESEKASWATKMKDLDYQLQLRNQEIARLAGLYSGGQNFDSMKSNLVSRAQEENLKKQEQEIDYLNNENHKLVEELQEVKELLCMASSSDPTQVDRVNLKTVIKKLASKKDQL